MTPVKRPTIISVIGILNIVFGSLGLFSYVCCGGISLLANGIMSQIEIPRGAGQPPVVNPIVELNKIPGYFAIQVVGVAMSAVTGTLLLASGIGFMKMKQWARVAGFLYSIIGILWAIASWILYQKFIGPGMADFNQRIQEQTGQPNPLLNNPGIMSVMVSMGMLINFAYPIAVLVLMLLPAVKNGLAGKPGTSWEPDPAELDGGVEPTDVGEQ